MRLALDISADELDVFMEETEEQISALDQGILVLEKEGPNSSLLDQIFRAAHTLKGSSSAIGHDRMATLTHALEGVLDLLRKGMILSTPPLIDLLLKTLDGLRILKEEVISREASDYDPGPLAESLRNVAEQRSAPVMVPPEPVTSMSPPPTMIEGARIYVRVDPQSPFGIARLLQAYLLAEETGTVKQSTPDKDTLLSEQAGSELWIDLHCDRTTELAECMKAIPDVVEVRIIAPAPETASSQTAALQADRAAIAEDDFDQRAKGAPAIAADQAPPKTVRIGVERLDALMNLVGELVIASTRLSQLTNRATTADGPETSHGMAQATLHIQHIADDLQDHVMKARMFPVAGVFARFPRMVRDLARRSGKDVELIIGGGETELDRSVIEEIADPLTHLLRNAVDHGIEPPAVRRAAGKSGSGHVRLIASNRENRILLTVEDDGRGINPVDLRQAIVNRGIVAADLAARMNDREALDCLFLPGFSTAREVTDISGRGVGLDIVRTNIRKLGGSVSVESVLGRGTRFIIDLPLTLAITDALLATVRDTIFAIPLSSVVETLRVDTAEQAPVNRGRVIRLREHLLPLMSMAAALNMTERTEGDSCRHVVVVRTGDEPLGIVVGELIGEQQVVVKALGEFVGNVPGISGATILGDGRVALIVDVQTLAKKRAREDRQDAAST